jgi:LuxR family maltose regulon positive regulatory protein
VAPALPARLVSRPHLIDQLELAADGPVTVVSAAAGWGKTTLLSSWVRETDATTAWVTVEHGDDSADFWAHLHEALSTVSGVGTRQATGPDPRLMPRRSYLCRLADVLAHRGAPVVVVLDSLDLIDDRTVPEELDFVVRHAQSGLRLVVAARTAPPPALHRWRLSGDLIEINSADLAFTRDEATQLLADHDIELPAADVDTILERTGGWATGLTLLAQAVRGHADPARWADQFSGDEATVAEYLDLEVLAGQPPHIRQVLLSTSVARRLNGSLVNALTDRTDGDRLLSHFVQCNLFTMAVADEPGWYRYHPMFADLLRSHLRRHMPGQHAEMHRRAAAWPAEHGLAPEALRHALVGGDRRYAATAVADQWPSLVLCRAGDETEDIEPLAEDAFRDAPNLALAYAADRLDAADPADTDRYLHLVGDSAGGEPSGNPARLTVLLTALRLARAHLFGEPARVTPLARQLLALLSDGESDQHLRARAAALTCLGSARLASGELAAAERTLADGVRAAERARLTCVQLTCAARLSVAQAALGALRRAEAGARVVLHMPPCRGGCGAFSRACAYLALAMVHYERDHLLDAERYLDAAQACSRRRADPFVVAAIATVRIALLRAQNHAVAAAIAQHRQIEALFYEVEAAPADRRETSFATLIDLIAEHEAAEDESVHRPVRDHLPGGLELIRDLHEEERTLRQILLRLINTGTRADTFEDDLVNLRDAFLAHAGHEERSEFVELRHRMPSEVLQQAAEPLRVPVAS